MRIMQRIIFPLTPPMQGPDVGNLQAALVLLGLTITDAGKNAQLYGASTRQAVSQFQTERHLSVTGIVNEVTASTMNNILAELGVLDDQDNGGDRRVQGTAWHTDGTPLAEITVRAFHLRVGGED